MTRSPSLHQLLTSFSAGLRERRDRRNRIRHPAEDRALRLHHREAHLVEFREIGGAAVGEHDAAIAAVVRLAHRGVDADFRGHAAHQQMLDAEIAQQRVEIGRVERALAGLVDHRLAGDRIELRDDVVAGLAADEDAPHRAGIADAHRGLAALELRLRRVGEIGAVPFARVDDQQSGGARGLEHRSARRDRAAEQRHVVAERFPEAARLEEVALHVDDDERGAGQVERDRFRFSLDGRAHARPRELTATEQQVRGHAADFC